ncbi:hypothetical protein BDK51DRAFT_30532, partial [Blyttiomyces helicus]
MYSNILDGLCRITDINTTLTPLDALRKALLDVTRCEKYLIDNKNGDWHSGTEDARTALEHLRKSAKRGIKKFSDAQKREKINVANTQTPFQLLIRAGEGYSVEATPDPPASGAPHLELLDAGTLLSLGQRLHQTEALFSIGILDFEFGQCFMGHEHHNFVRFGDKPGSVIISVRSESGTAQSIKSRGSNLGITDSDGETPDGETGNILAIVLLKEAGPHVGQWKASDQRLRLPLNASGRGKLTAKSVLQMVIKDINGSKLRRIVDTAIEKKIVELDELMGQNLEFDMLGNETSSPAFDTFLSIIGERVELKGYGGFAGGLDTKMGQTGELSVAARWRQFDVMYHVSTLFRSRRRSRSRFRGSAISET